MKTVYINYNLTGMARVAECQLVGYDGDRYCRLNCSGQIVDANVGHVFLDPHCNENVDYVSLFAVPRYS